MGRPLTAWGEQRARKRLMKYTEQAEAAMVALGHTPGAWEIEEGWHAVVTECGRCRMLAAIDLTEKPYLFGKAYKQRCK